MKYKRNVLVEHVWEADRQKVENAEKMGDNVLVVWEHDLYQSTSNVEKEILNEIHRTN
jgi:G:T-mismatch repair DNA endonuclease (very short patch repair protein)